MKTIQLVQLPWAITWSEIVLDFFRGQQAIIDYNVGRIANIIKFNAIHICTRKIEIVLLFRRKRSQKCLCLDNTIHISSIHKIMAYLQKVLSLE